MEFFGDFQLPAVGAMGLLGEALGTLGKAIICWHRWHKDNGDWKVRLYGSQSFWNWSIPQKEKDIKASKVFNFKIFWINSLGEHWNITLHFVGDLLLLSHPWCQFSVPLGKGHWRGLPWYLFESKTFLNMCMNHIWSGGWTSRFFFNMHVLHLSISHAKKMTSKQKYVPRWNLYHMR